MKKIKLFVVLCICMILFAGCRNREQEKYMKKLAGDWNCEKSPLESKDIYTGYLVMHINKNGKFTMYDAEAGNPGIQGKMESVKKDQLVLNCSRFGTFDPPSGWKKMKKKQTISYKLKGKQKLYMLYKNGKDKVTLVFDRNTMYD